MYFKFFKLQDWGKRSAAVRRRNCAVLPLFPIACHNLFEQLLGRGRGVCNGVGSGLNGFQDTFIGLAAGGNQGTAYRQPCQGCGVPGRHGRCAECPHFQLFGECACAVCCRSEAAAWLHPAYQIPSFSGNRQKSPQPVAYLGISIVFWLFYQKNVTKA